MDKETVSTFLHLPSTLGSQPLRLLLRLAIVPASVEQSCRAKKIHVVKKAEKCNLLNETQRFSTLT